MAPSRKQELYAELLGRTLPSLRNLSTQSWWHRARNRAFFFESELVHNLFVSILDPEFGSHDLWFLNRQARAYVDSCSEKVSSLYKANLETISELFKIVPESQRNALDWPGPSSN